MSINVLIIPEDFRKDQYILRPIIEQMMKTTGRRARVRVCFRPLLGGISKALKWYRISSIIDSYKGMTHLFLLIVDRDGDVNRRARLDGLEREAAEKLAGTGDRFFLGENAWQEVEVWALAGLHNLPGGWVWKEVRQEPNPKETYYDPYARQRGLLDTLHQGRGRLGKEAARNYSRIRQLCPEDVGELETRIHKALGEGS